MVSVFSLYAGILGYESLNVPYKIQDGGCQPEFLCAQPPHQGKILEKKIPSRHPPESGGGKGMFDCIRAGERQEVAPLDK